MLSPDLVISYTGCINLSRGIEYPFTSDWKNLLNSLTFVQKNENLVFSNIDQKNKYIGIRNSLSRFQYFLLQAKLLWGGASAVGINYKCIVQPTIYTKKSLTKEEVEQLIYYDSVHIKKQSNEFFEELKECVGDYPWLYDYSEIFDDMEGVYRDLYHVNGKGNRVVAEKIYRDVVRKE